MITIHFQFQKVEFPGRRTIKACLANLLSVVSVPSNNYNENCMFDVSFSFMGNATTIGYLSMVKIHELRLGFLARFPLRC